MKTNYILILISFLTCLRLVGQDTLEFIKVGDYGAEEGVQIVKISDSTYYILANTADEFNNSDYQLIEYSSKLGIIRAVNYGTLNSDRALDAAYSDSTLVVVGLTNGRSAVYEGFMHIISNDSFISEYYWGSHINSTWLQASQVLIKDTLIYVWFEDVFKNLSPSLHKFTLSGDPLGVINFPQLPGASIREFDYDSLSQNFFASGSIKNENNDRDAFLLSINNELENEWIYTVNKERDEIFEDFARLNDTTIVLVGYSNSFFEEDEDILVVKLNLNNLQPDSILIQGYDSTVNENRDDRAYSILINDDTIFITGVTATFGQGGMDGYITLLDENLIPIPRGSTFGSPGDDYSFSLWRDRDLLFGVGVTYFQTKGISDILIWERKKITKTTLYTSVSDFFLVSSGIVLGTENTQRLVNEDLTQKITIINGLLTVDENIKKEFERIQLYNISGVRISENINEGIQVTGLSTGIYNLVFYSELNVTTVKMFIP